MNLNHEAESWARVVPKAFLEGSIVQASNVIGMAVEDIAKFSAEIERLKAELARAERNRDMWKGQVERQAERLTEVHTVLREVAEASQAEATSRLRHLARASLSRNVAGGAEK